jgi:predicted transposase YdaD
MDMPEIFTWWVQEGIAEGEVRGERKKALDAAHKMREHGISWEIVTDVTGLKPEELE